MINDAIVPENIGVGLDRGQTGVRPWVRGVSRLAVSAYTEPSLSSSRSLELVQARLAGREGLPCACELQ